MVGGYHCIVQGFVNPGCDTRYYLYYVFVIGKITNFGMIAG